MYLGGWNIQVAACATIMTSDEQELEEPKNRHTEANSNNLAFWRVKLEQQ